MPSPEIGIEALHGGGGASVLPPERHAHIQRRLVKQVHEEPRVFLVREVVRDLLRVFGQSHRLANRVEVGIAVARQRFVVLVDRHLDVAAFIQSKNPLGSGICSWSQS